VVEVKECEAHVRHLEEVPKDQAWVVKIILKAVSQDGSLFSDPVKKMISWDDELAPQAHGFDRKSGRISEERLESFCGSKRKPSDSCFGTSAPWQILRCESFSPLFDLQLEPK